ncbi:MAG: SDR family NAD(P)-dependent oxidoreductase [Anaerolineae bacterium]|nr:SDR family NAD(P)-dependent oxidoreductase [Anaerolineae bacterium]
MDTILITGATDGLGLALARHYLPTAERLILVGRRAFRDVPLTGFDPNAYCRVDLAHANGAEVIDNWLEARNIRHLDLLIHNAGTGYYGAIDRQPWTDIEQLVAVNVWAPIALTRQLLPCLHKRQGKVVFISSVAAMLPTPHYAVYGATKAALDGFARSLRVEMKGAIDVQIIHPGAARTGMHAKSGISREVMDWERFPPAEIVAQKIAKAITTKKPSVTIGVGNSLLGFAGLYLSRVIDRVMQRRQR